MEYLSIGKTGSSPIRGVIFKEAVSKDLCEALSLLSGPLWNFINNCYTEIHREDTECHKADI
jgi:hypothetical protein